MMTRLNAFRRLLISLAVLACGLAPVCAQDETATESVVRKVIRLEHISPQQAYVILSPLLKDPRPSIVPELGLISVQGSESVIRDVERILQELDVPRPEAESAQSLNVVFTGYLVGASDSSQESPIPEQVRDAVTEMRRHFPYKNFTLLETFGIRTKVHAKAVLSGLTSIAADQPAMRYEIAIETSEVSGTATKRTIHIDNLKSTWQLPTKTEPAGSDFEVPELSTSLDIPEGATVVVGKSGAAVGTYRGIFLLLKAEVVEP